jgi:hypothetical protein
MIAWIPFVNPMHLSPGAELWLLLPLALAVAVVYKTVRAQSLPMIPRQVGALYLYLVAALTVLCGALWAVQALFL